MQSYKWGEVQSNGFSGSGGDMVRFRFALFLVLFAAVAFAARPAHADTFYDVSGTLTLTGNNACGSSPCTETIDFSFELDEGFNSVYDAYGLTFVPGTSTTTSSGPLGTMYFAGASGGPLAYQTPGPGNGNVNFTAFNSSPDPVFADSLELYVAENLQPDPFIPSFDGGTLYSCATATCVTDFCPPSFCTSGGVDLGIFAPASTESTVTAAPEPSALALLAFGLLALCFLGRRNRNGFVGRWGGHKIKKEVNPVSMRPHPHEFELYYDI
ncbi:MAG: PEP-CTERM sorting domain-containing protein [Candidatus Acidiferrales bacterium]